MNYLVMSDIFDFEAMSESHGEFNFLIEHAKQIFKSWFSTKAETPCNWSIQNNSISSQCQALHHISTSSNPWINENLRIRIRLFHLFWNVLKNSNCRRGSWGLLMRSVWNPNWVCSIFKSIQCIFFAHNSFHNNLYVLSCLRFNFLDIWKAKGSWWWQQKAICISQIIILSIFFFILN